MGKKYVIDESTLTDMANAIRSKTSSTASMTAEEMDNAILSIETGVDTSDATALSSEIFLDKTAYVDGEKITGEFTIDAELNEQEELLTQIEASLSGKITGSGGYDEGYADGVEVGVQQEYNRFWDKLQQNGSRTNYNYGFAYDCWTDDIFEPKYPLIVSTAAGMFVYSAVTHAPEIDFTNCTNCNSAFMYSTLETIDKLILSENTTLHLNMFNMMRKLKNIVIEGSINNVSLGFTSTTVLTKESITSIINALSSTASGLTVSFSNTAKTNAFTDEEWATLIATKSNWTINLV